MMPALKQQGIWSKVFGHQHEERHGERGLREIVDRRRREAAVQRLRQMVDSGEIDFSILESEQRHT
ncbi:hypothetical protein ACQPXH_30000 [Nocardia sp. CA-135953]|uniref:hypothetical protein n=1 Tax=Nocardia sp. CA-135953 TaxID=3239978 RepID=UPI003D96414F